jgi:tetratricopeptide (TPR) repeat protein
VRLAVAVTLGLLAAACAKRLTVPLPEGEHYVAPAVAGSPLSEVEERALRAAWSEVLAGDLAAAERRYRRLLVRRPGLPPAATGLSYARLRAGRLEEAAAGFAAVLQAHPDDVSALVGAGATAARRGRLDEALAAYRRALRSVPEDPLVRKRVATLKLRVTERRLALAEAALERGEQGEAAREYRAALEAAPEVTGVRLALAEILAGQGDPWAAVALLEADPKDDRQVALVRAGLLMELKEFARAIEVYEALRALDPSDEAARAGEAAAREALFRLGMPEEYQRIETAPGVTRAELAALLVVRVPALRRAAPGEPRVAVDIGGSWAREHVARVLALGIMDVYPNHTFQPGAAVRRVDLARALARVLDRLGWPPSPPQAPADMPRSHLDYAAVARAVGAGVLGLTEAGDFEPWRPVSGREAADAADALDRLVP